MLMSGSSARVSFPPGGVQARVSAQRGGHRLYERVGVADLARTLLSRAPFLRGVAPGDQARGIDLAQQVEVRDARPRLRDALGHDAPDGRNGPRPRIFKGRARGEGRRLLGGAPFVVRRSSFVSAEHVRRQHRALRPAPADGP
jgi:hypothetical protein